MVDQAALREQNNSAYIRAQAWVDREDGWELFHCEHEVTTWINRLEKVVKIQGKVNKAPHTTISFVLGHLAEIRQNYVKTAVSTEVLQAFEDMSRLIREVNNYPSTGELVTFRYGIPRAQSDGSIHFVVNSPEGFAEYPRGHSWLDFQLAIISANEEGSTFSIYIHQETTLVLTTEQQNTVALELAQMFSNAARDLNDLD